MKILAFILLFGTCILPAYAQNLLATTPAKLQVYALKPDGSQAMMTSDYLNVNYRQLNMTGELILSSLVTGDQILRGLVDSALYEKITFSGVIPEGKFIFKDELNSKFSVETDLVYGDLQSKILIDFDVSNRNTSLANTFAIICTGNISLSNDLGISRDPGIADKVSFQYYHNVIVRNY